MEKQLLFVLDEPWSVVRPRKRQTHRVVRNQISPKVFFVPQTKKALVLLLFGGLGERWGYFVVLLRIKGRSFNGEKVSHPSGRCVLEVGQRHFTRWRRAIERYEARPHIVARRGRRGLAANGEHAV